MTAPQTISSGTLDAFVDGEVISAEGTSPAPYSGALNPKMRIISSVVNDHASWIETLQAQIITLSGTANVFNVKAPPYNAVGNGIANDTTAIQNAVTDACAVNGIVVFPAGTYMITSEITVTNAVTITSDVDVSTSIIKQTGTVTNAIFNITGNYVSISRLTFQTTQNTASGRGLIYSSSASGISNLLVDRCLFSGLSANMTAIYLSNSNYSYITNCIFTGVSTYSNAFLSLLSSTQVTIQNNQIANVDRAISVTSTCTDISIISNRISLFKGYAIYFTNTTNSEVQSNFIQVPRFPLGFSNPSAIYIGINCSSISIASNIVDMSNNTASYEMPAGIILVPNATGTSHAIIANTFVACNSGIYVTTEGIYTISNNVFNRCFSYCVRIGTISTGTVQGTVIGNTFTDLFSDTASTGDAVFISITTSGSNMSVVGNVLARGSLTTGTTYAGKTVTTINYRALNMPIGNSITLYQANNFKSATVFPNSAAYSLYYEDINNGRVYSGSAAPTTGSYIQGDRVMNTAPTASGYIGWVCVSSGVPGTWKGFGLIQT